MSRFSALTVLGVIVLSGLVSPTSAPAQSPPAPWNRRFEAVSVQPVPGGRAGMYEIQPFFTVEAGQTTAPLNLSTIADVIVNGRIVKTLMFSIVADPAAAAGCNVPCHELGQVCVCLEGVLCSCGAVLACDPPFPSALRPGDELTVILHPAPGALPDTEEEDDRFSIVFEGKPIGWDRRIGGVRLTAERDGTRTVEVAMDTFASYAGALRLDAEVAVLVNGEPMASGPVAADDYVWASCGSGCTGSACGRSSGGDPALCVEEIQEYGTFCWCSAESSGTVVFTGLEAAAGDEITVILYPAPGALPDKMGDSAADERTLVVPGSPSEWDRKVESLELTAVPGSQAGLFRPQIQFSVAVLSTPSLLDLSTEAELLVNGKPVQTTRHQITADPSGAAGCNVPCHELGKVCVCVEGLFCGCGTILISPDFDPVGLEPGDEIVVILRPAPGALPELPGLDEDEHTLVVPRPSAIAFRRGDVNDDGKVDMGDAVASLGWQFLGTKAPGCADAADTDDSGEIGIGDPIGLLNWLFLGAAPPRRPGPFDCGEDPTEDRLPECEQTTCPARV